MSVLSSVQTEQNAELCVSRALKEPLLRGQAHLFLKIYTRSEEVSWMRGETSLRNRHIQRCSAQKFHDLGD